MAPLLILDDLGTESATAWAREKLYQLFNYRYNARLATVITSAMKTGGTRPAAGDTDARWVAVDVLHAGSAQLSRPQQGAEAGRAAVDCASIGLPLVSDCG